VLQERCGLVGGQGVEQDPQDTGQQTLRVIRVGDNLKSVMAVNTWSYQGVTTT